jgi:hypothetical protein
VSGKWASRAKTLAQYGATGAEIAFLRDQRVELNAMTSRQFVDHLEAKLAEHGVTKVLPEEKVLEGHARYFLEVLSLTRSSKRSCGRCASRPRRRSCRQTCASGSPSNSRRHRPGRGIA